MVSFVGVSIPFIAGQWSLPLVSHERRGKCSRVSIPFIAGQWSLLASQNCRRISWFGVSIPFIAGQWSLLVVRVVGVYQAVMFQSPSLRGSGRFRATKVNVQEYAMSFNPLHCGAVVASRIIGELVGFGGFLVSIPFIAGQWSLLSLPEVSPVVLASGFQSPSLRGSGRFFGAGRDRR